MDMHINYPQSIKNLLTLYVNVYKGGKTMGQVSKGAMETLRRGSKGRNVKELQLRLN